MRNLRLSLAAVLALLLTASSALAGTTATFATATRNARMDAITASLSSCYIRIYDGTKPATPATALAGSNHVLCEMRCSATAAPAAANGVLTLNAITSDASNDATGTAAFARIFASNGTTVIADVDVATAGAAINLNSIAITAAGTCAITSATLTD